MCNTVNLSPSKPKAVIFDTAVLGVIQMGDSGPFDLVAAAVVPV